MNKIIISTIAAAAVLGATPALAGKAQPPGAGAQTTGATTTNASINQAVSAAASGTAVTTSVIANIASLPGATSLPGGGVSINVNTGSGIVTVSIDGSGNVTITPVDGGT